jgi:hypothetical protein
VTKVTFKGKSIAELETSAGNKYLPGSVVIAEDPWCTEVVKLMGIELPVQPLRRMIHVVKPQKDFCQNCPKIFIGAGPSITL